jgi:hypothetical protein
VKKARNARPENPSHFIFSKVLLAGFRTVFDEIPETWGLSLRERERSPADPWHRCWRIPTASAFLIFRQVTLLIYPGAE